MVSEIIKWHIADISEDDNFKQSFYIHSLILLTKFKLNLQKEYKTILDIPCGIGRHHTYLRNFGYEVYGADISEELIKLAKERNKGFENFYFVGDMRNFKLNKKVDVILNWFTSFGYFDHEDNLKTVENFYENLDNEGILILEHGNFQIFDEKPIIHEYDKYIEITKISKFEDRLEFNNMFYRKEGENLIFEESIKVILRNYKFEEIVEIIKKYFKIAFIFSTLTFKEFDLNKDRRFVIVAIKS